MEANEYIINKYKPNIPKRMPIELDMCRDDLPVLWKELGYEVGAEIGVETGVYSKIICDAGLELHAIDAWTAYKGYRDHVSQSKLDGFLEGTRERLKNYNAHVVKGFSMDVVKTFKDESLDFVYIDANHDFQNVTNDVVEWGKKVRKGGMISGHDYSRFKNHHNHTKDVINGYTYAYGITPWFVTTKDRSNSWFWIK